MLRIFTLVFLVIFLISCDESTDDTGTKTTNVDFALSGSAVEDLSEVVISIDSVILQNKTGEQVVIDEFYNSNEPDLPLAQIQIDLLDYQGSSYKTIIQDFQLQVGLYQELKLEVVDSDISYSYVTESSGAIKPIKATSFALNLEGFSVDTSGLQNFIIEFDFRQSLVYNPITDTYMLKPRGVRVIDKARSVNIFGTVDLNYYHSLEPCSEKSDIRIGNILYLYQGNFLDPSLLTDQLDLEWRSNQITNQSTPYTSASLSNLGQYLFSFLPAGEYTVAFSCLAENDNPDILNNIMIPTPESAISETSLRPGEEAIINFPQFVE